MLRFSYRYVLALLWIPQLQTRAFGQDHPDAHETGCLAGCTTVYIEFDDEMANAPINGPIGNGASAKATTGGSSTSSGGGTSSPGGALSDPGVEPQRSLSPLPLLILALYCPVRVEVAHLLILTHYSLLPCPLHRCHCCCYHSHQGQVRRFLHFIAYPPPIRRGTGRRLAIMSILPSKLQKKLSFGRKHWKC